MSRYRERWPVKLASGSATASSAGVDGDVRQLPLVSCLDCGHRVIRLQSKQPKTFGEYFFKCEENEQDDPTTCGFYKWENQYRKWLRKNFHIDDLVHDENSQMRSTMGRAQVEERDEKHEFVELKHEIGQLKHEFVQLKHGINDLKHEISSLSTKCSFVKSGIVVDSVLVFSTLVGCVVGILVAFLCK